MLWPGFFKEEITRSMQDGQGRELVVQNGPQDTILMCRLPPTPSLRKALPVHAEAAVKNSRDETVTMQTSDCC